MAGGGLLVVVLVVLAFIFLGAHASNTQDNGQAQFGPAPAKVVAAVTNPAPSVIDRVGTGGQPGNLNRVTGPSAKDGQGKPIITYVGAEYCPYCAAERWSLVMALARFGQFSSLQEMQSASDDAYPDTSTFTFAGTDYSSQTIDFQSAELQDRFKRPFESPSATVSRVFTDYGKPPFSANTQAYPFLDIANMYVLNATSYSPELIQGLSWDQIATRLSNPEDPVTQAIVGNANYITAAICSATDNQPAAACTPTIRSIETQLQAQPPVNG